MKQWYEKHPEIQDMEKKAMQNVCPSAKYCYLPSGDAGWIVNVRTLIKGERKEWIFLIKYPSDHPSIDGSIRCYLIKPTYYDLQGLVDISNIEPKTIPYILFDTENNMYYLPLCKEGDRRGIRHAEIAYAGACQWMRIFELAITDQTTWAQFQRKPLWTSG